MLSKYLNKTEKELSELSERWEAWERLKTWNAKPRKTVDEIAEFYINMPDGYMANLEKIAQSKKEFYLKGVKGKKILDFGCGTGVYGLEMLKQGAEVDFFDLPTRAMEFVKWRVEQAGMKARFLTDMADLDKGYDAIICVDVLEHMRFPFEALTLLHNKLKMFGAFVLDSPLIRPMSQNIPLKDLVDGEHIEEAVKEWFGNHANEFIMGNYVTVDNHFVKTCLRMLMIYNYTPGTTGDFIERALRRYVKVITNRDVQIGGNGEGIKTVCEQMGINCVLQVDSGGWTRMPKIKTLKAAYSIDTFTAPDKIKKDILYPYDIKFYAQKKFAQEKNEYWLPLAVDPEVYKPIHCILKYDVAFCGTFIVKRSQAKRNACLKALANEHMKGAIELYIGRDYNEYAGLRYNESKFVFNMGICDDINMRLCEAAACGTPQFYNEVDGLSDLGFLPDEHYIKFTDASDIVKTMYLTFNEDKLHPELDPMHKAIKVKDAAYQLVMSRHTYDHRAREIVKVIMENMK